MSDTFEAVRAAISRGAIQVSRHAIRELEADVLLLDAILSTTLDGELIEDYPEALRGPFCLVGRRLLLNAYLRINPLVNLDEVLT